MRPSQYEAIRPHLERAASDIHYYLAADQERESIRQKMDDLYAAMEAGNTPPEVKGSGTKKLSQAQYNALIYMTTANGKLLTDKQRETGLAKLGAGETISDAGREAVAYWARGGWRESSREAANWLRNAGYEVEASGIEIELSPLPERPRDAAELPGYREAMRLAAEQIKRILDKVMGANKQPRKQTEQGSNNSNPANETGKDDSTTQVVVKALGSQDQGAYNWPDEYERDKWIYDNIGCHSKDGLSQKLNSMASKRQWFPISSRNGLKKIADRFAKFHGFPKKRFPRNSTAKKD